MTDQTIPADAIRAWRDKYRGCTGNNALEALDALIPAPPRPTLADMTPEERAECRWAQADVKGRLDRWAIARPFGEGGDVEAVSESGQISWFPTRHVIPRPDLPRLTWPGEQQPAPALALPEGWRLADHKKHGRAIVTNTTPDGGGYVYLVAPATGPRGHTWHLCDLDELTYIDTEPEADQ